MRILLSRDSRNKLFDELITSNNCRGLKELSLKLGIPLKTIQNWKYGERHMPESIIPLKFKKILNVLDKQEDNWGKILGGKKTYRIILERYGAEEIRKRQSAGGKKSFKNLKKIAKNFNIDLKNNQFLEFYGALLGDGWLSKLKLKTKSKNIWLIGFSGHMNLDEMYHLYLQKIIRNLFSREGYIRKRPKYSGRELLIGHRALLEFLHKRLNFPIGLKKNLEIPREIIDFGFDYTRFVIRGIFDTDGSFFFDKTPVGKPYPIISIYMREPILINQIKELLSNEGFKPLITHNGEEIKLKGGIQLRKWMNKIGSSNLKHLNKINALVAQPG